MKKQTPLPPWKTPNEREAKPLIKWTKAKLEEERGIINAFIHAGDSSPQLPPSIEERRRARCKTPSGRTGRPRTEKHGDLMWEALWDVAAIRQIWREHYGKHYRPKNDAVRAEKIAAERWDVDLDTLGDWVNKHKKP